MKKLTVLVAIVFCAFSAHYAFSAPHAPTDQIQATLDLACEKMQDVMEIEEEMETLDPDSEEYAQLAELRAQILKYIHYNLRNQLAMQYHKHYTGAQYTKEELADINTTFEYGTIPQNYVNAASDQMRNID